MATAASGKKRMTQSEVINHFAERFGLKRAQVKELFEELANLASTEVKSNGELLYRASASSSAPKGKLVKAVIRRPAKPFRFLPKPRSSFA